MLKVEFVDMEMGCCGRAILYLYIFFYQKKHGKEPEAPPRNPEIVENAKKKTCDVSVEAVNLWLKFFGRLCGYYSVALGARSGLYTVGSVCNGMMHWMKVEDEEKNIFRVKFCSFLDCFRRLEKLFPFYKRKRPVPKCRQACH
jgi:glucokinase